MTEMYSANRVIQKLAKDSLISTLYEEIDKRDCLGENKAFFTITLDNVLTQEILYEVFDCLARNKALSGAELTESAMDSGKYHLEVRWKRNKAYKAYEKEA